MMYGIVIIILLIILSGLIAYLGDQIGMKVGKKRISIFGLRPKYSSIIITVITGILIAALSITILLTVYGSLREAIFNINKVVLRLENLDEELKQKDEKLKNMQEEINTKSEELEILQTQKTNLESKLNDLQNELKMVEDELKNTKDELAITKKELTKTEEDLKSAEENIAALRKNRDQLNQRISELNDQKNELEAKVSSLNERMSKLTEDYEVASELANRLGEDMYYYMREDMVYQKGDTVYAKVIEGGQSENDTINALNKFLTEANEAAKSRPIKVDEETGMALELQTEDILYTARVLYNMDEGQQVIVSLVSSVNVPRNEWLKANFVLEKNFKVFAKGDFIAAKVIDANDQTAAIDAELRSLLAEVNKKAKENGLITDSEGQVGSIDFINFYQLVENVKSKNEKIRVNVHASKDIWRNDRLGANIRFSIERVETEDN
mgnify:CR=1 FL=1